MSASSLEIIRAGGGRFAPSRVCEIPCVVRSSAEVVLYESTAHFFLLTDARAAGFSPPARLLLGVSLPHRRCLLSYANEAPQYVFCPLSVQVAEYLRARDISAAPYHAGMTPAVCSVLLCGFKRTCTAPVRASVFHFAEMHRFSVKPALTEGEHARSCPFSFARVLLCWSARYRDR